MTDGRLIFCQGCRRILGYFDEENVAHLYNVRLQSFEAPRVEVTDNQRLLFVRVSEVSLNKRKYPIDSLDLADEPPAKKRCLEECIMSIELTNGVSTVTHDIGEEEKRADESELSLIDLDASVSSFLPRIHPHQLIIV